MSRWFRYYDGALDDPKVQRLSSDLFRAWVNLLCLASKSGGCIRSAADAAFALRVSESKARSIIIELASHNLLDAVEGGYFEPHNWQSRQYKSDVTDPTAPKRMRNYRNRQRNADCNAADEKDRNDTVTVTPTRADTETEQIEDTANAVSLTSDKSSSKGPYCFEKGVIRLKQKDFDQWKRAFAHLALEAELVAIAPWAEQQPNWFHAVAGALNKKNREIGIRLEQGKNGPTFKTISGMDGII